jgi:hypothetical protein
MTDEFRKRINGKYCIYCGDIATTDEHFPPKSATNKGLILSACIECNMIAGTECAFNFDERCNYVIKKLKEKYKEIIKANDWTIEELINLDDELIIGTVKWMRQKKKIHERIAWSALSYLSCIDHNNYFVQQNVKIATIINQENKNYKNTLEWSRQKKKIHERITKKKKRIIEERKRIDLGACTEKS